MKKHETADIDQLVKNARQGDVESAIEAIERIKQADYLLTSQDREARHFRLGVMPADCDKLRDTADRARASLRELFRLHPEYKTAGFKI